MFLNAGTGAFLTGVFQHQCITPHEHWRRRVGREHHDRCLSTLVVVMMMMMSAGDELDAWCSSTLHIGWGLCDRVCQVLVCRGRYGLGGGVSLHSGIEFGLSRTSEGSSGGRKKGVV